MPVNIELRDVAPADLPFFFENQRDPEAMWMAAFTAKDPNDRKAFDTHWAHILADDTVMNRTILFEGQVVGSVSSYVLEHEPEVSYWIGREFWGNGIATAALAEFLTIQTARPIFARVAEGNPGSLRVLEKCGFQIIGKDKGFANARGAEIEEFILKLSA